MLAIKLTNVSRLISLSLVKDKHAEMMENRGPPFFCSWFCFMCSVKTDRGTKKKKRFENWFKTTCPLCMISLFFCFLPLAHRVIAPPVYEMDIAQLFSFCLFTWPTWRSCFFIVWILDGHRKTKDGARTRTFFFFFKADEVFERFPFCCFIVLLRLFSFFCSYRPWETTRTVLTPPSKEKLH